MDNVCAEPNPSDARYLDGLHKTYARHMDFPRTQPKDMVRLFPFLFPSFLGFLGFLGFIFTGEFGTVRQR